MASTSVVDEASLCEGVDGLDLTDTPSTAVTLDSFRDAWKKEIEEKLEPPNEHDQAKELFLSAVECERNGEMSEAVRQYSRAYKLVPDIERRLFPPAPARPRVRERSRSRGAGHLGDSQNQLSATFRHRLTTRGSLFEPANANESCGLSSLSFDLVHFLARFVVGSHLDIPSLETLSQVSACFYLISRGNDLWRRAVEKACVNIDDDEEEETVAESAASIRDLFYRKAHLAFHGVYVSKMTYIRYGDNCLQDRNFQAWHMISYFRLIRFCPGGDILMVTSNELPKISVSGLRNRWALKDSTVLRGKWWIEDGDVIAKIFRHCDVPVVTRRKKTRNAVSHVEYGISSHEFGLRLGLVPAKTGRQWSLVWKRYVCTITYFDGNTAFDDFEVDKDTQSYPPMRFHPTRVVLNDEPYSQLF